MKVLIVCSGNAPNFNFRIHQAFIYEQIEAVKKYYGIDYDTYFINGKGVLGYLSNLSQIKKKIVAYSPDIIHAHFGLSGLVSCFQRSVPIVITFHGSDAYISYVRLLSKMAARLSSSNIFVENKIKSRINIHSENNIIPCGIDLEKFYPVDKQIARVKLNLEQEKKYILFSSRFDNDVKNYPLAATAIEKSGANVELVELKNKVREEVNLLLNACDMLLLTSFSEGSPQITKEAMACNCPIVATDVGDIKEIIGDTEGCYITSFDPNDVAEKIKLAINFSCTKGRTNGRERIKHLDNKIIAKKIFEIYKSVLNESL